MLKEKLYQAGISHIDISRTNTRLHVTIFTAKPGIVIGRGGAGAEAVKNDIARMTGKPVNTIQLDIMEIKHPDTNAQLVAENIAQQLEKRISFRRAMKQTIGRAMKAGAKGIKTSVLRPSGRRGHRPQRGLPRGFHPAADAARQHRLRLRRGQDHLWPHRRQGMDLQGTGAAQGQEGPRRSPPPEGLKEGNKSC